MHMHACMYTTERFQKYINITTSHIHKDATKIDFLGFIVYSLGG